MFNTAVKFGDYLSQIRDFTLNDLIPHESFVEESGYLPEEIVHRMRELGLFGISIPKEFHGLGLTQEQQVEVTLMITQASCAYRSRFASTIGLTSQAILDHGTDEQKKRYLPLMAAGNCTGAFALTELEAGSDAASVQTTATKVGDSYVLNGQKHLITNAPDADLFVVFARVAGAPDRSLSGFLVEATTDGLDVGPALPLMGQRGTHVAQVFFDDCKIPATSVLGGSEGIGLKAALRGINHARVHIAALGVGQSLRLIAEANAYALQRRQFGQPIADFQAIETLLATSYSETLAAQALVRSVARMFDESNDIPVTEIAAAKYFCTETATKVADRCIQVMGGNGYIEGHPIPRMYRDVRALPLYEGASQIQLRTVAKALKAGEKVSVMS